MAGAGYGISDGSGGFVTKLEGDGDAKIGDSSGDVIQITGSLDVNGNIYAAEFIYHKGDDDTFVKFTDDVVILKAGGKSMFRGDPTNASGQILINNGGHDLDVLVRNAASGTLLYTDAGNSRVGIGTDAPDYELDVAGNIGVDERIYHNGDADTYMIFTDDRVQFEVGNLKFLGMHKKAGAPHQVTVNSNNNNIDFVVNSNDVSTSPILRADASTARVGIGTASPSVDLDVAGDVNFDGAAVFNESSADKDFRVESNHQTHMFYIDGGNNRIGLGTSGPQFTIDVQERTGVEAVLRMVGDADVGIRLAADSDNSGENDNPYIDWYQDGQNSNSRNNRLASMAMEGDAAGSFTDSLANAFFMDAYCPGSTDSHLRTIQFANDSSNNGHKARITIEGTNGYVGIWKNDAEHALDVDGNTKSNYYITTPTTQDLGSGVSSTLSIASSLMFLDADAITGTDPGIGMDVHTLNIPNGTTSGQKLTLVIEGNMGAANNVPIMIAGNIAGASDMFMPSSKTSLNFVYYSTASISAWYQV